MSGYAVLFRENRDLSQRLGHDSEIDVVADLDDARALAVADIGDAAAEQLEIGRNLVVGLPRPGDDDAEFAGAHDLGIPTSRRSALTLIRS